MKRKSLISLLLCGAVELDGHAYRYRIQANSTYPMDIKISRFGADLASPEWDMSHYDYRLDLNVFQVYSIYKQRQAIEQFFKTYGDTMSYKDLTQTLIKIKAGKMDGEWVVCPIKKSVQRLCGKMQFNPNDLTELKL